MLYWRLWWRSGQGYRLLVRVLLHAAPTPVWRFPAHVSAEVRALTDATLPEMTAPCAALGLVPTWRHRWRLRRAIAFHDAVDRLLGWQQTRLTPAWVAHHVVLPERTLPAGGAVVLIFHQANTRLMAPLLRAQGRQQLGLVSKAPVALGQRSTEAHEPLMHAAFDTVFTPRQAARGGLRLLQEGGYLVITVDAMDDVELIDPRWPSYPLLGRKVPLPPGPLWFAQRAGKPLVAAVLVPQGRRWRVWISAPLTPTPSAVACARERGVQRAGTTWAVSFWRAWCAAPVMERGRSGTADYKGDPVANGRGGAVQVQN